MNTRKAAEVKGSYTMHGIIVFSSDNQRLITNAFIPTKPDWWLPTRLPPFGNLNPKPW